MIFQRTSGLHLILGSLYRMTTGKFRHGIAQATAPPATGSAIEHSLERRWNHNQYEAQGSGIATWLDVQLPR